jgi:hypothetical protein
MAKKEAEHRGKKPKHKLRSMTIHKTDKAGEHVIEHHYEDHDGNKLPSRLAQATTGMDDLHQHVEDHLGPEAEADDEQQPGAGGAQPADPGAAGAGAGGAAPEPGPAQE